MKKMFLSNKIEYTKEEDNDDVLKEVLLSSIAEQNGITKPSLSTLPEINLQQGFNK